MKNYIEQATINDVKEIASLLQEVNLPYQDIDLNIQNFLIIRRNRSIIGIIGLEQYKNQALLRSFAVKEEYQGQGIGKELYLHLLELCKINGVKFLYLLTTTDEDWFLNHGWIKIKKDTVPEKIKNTTVYKNIYPSGAICMFLCIEDSQVKNAISKFMNYYNCAQSVFASFAIDYGIVESNALKMASGFGAGISYQGKTCGAVTGAYMTLGLIYGYDESKNEILRKGFSDKIATFNREFISRNGSLDCKDLINGDVSDEKQLENLRKKGVFREICPYLVKDAAEILSDIIHNDKKE